MDFTINNQGTLVGFTPQNDQAAQWLDENTETEGHQWMGPTLWVGSSWAQCLINGILEAGYTI